MMKKSIFAIALMLFTFGNSQVGINTTVPNGATVLDINSNAKGILIPRLSDTERNTSLADNNIATVPTAGVFNASLSPGTLIYNTTVNRFEFWDGVLWRQLFVATSSAAGNDGVVRVDSGAGGLLPAVDVGPSGSSYGTPQQIIYTTPLVFAPPPTTSWPENTVPYPGQTPNIYVEGPILPTGDPLVDPDQRWVENPIYGQVHIWRVIAKVTADSNNSGSLLARFINPDSDFEVNSISILPAGSSGDAKIVTFYFYTIADQFSIPVTTGYQLFMTADQKATVEIQSVTRVSLFKD